MINTFQMIKHIYDFNSIISNYEIILKNIHKYMGYKKWKKKPI